MRVKAVSPLSNELEVLAVSGTHVITLGINLPENKRQGLLGFSIQRKDHTSGNVDWLEAMKVFKSVVPVVTQGESRKTNQHPIQDFFWSDFTVRNGRTYTYRILARKGTPQNLVTADEVSVTISAEDYDKKHKHTAYFNRGVAGSQAFIKKFGDGEFNKIAKEKIWVWEWLSRGLREAATDFLREATDSTFAIRGAIYEFQFEPILAELWDAAVKRKVDVKVIYTAKNGGPTDHTKEKNETAIKNTLIKNFVIPRINCSKIAHNKFFILLKDNQPIAVWTGSTNLTTGGIHGHSNVGHLVRDEKIAQKYLEYWNFLQNDPEQKNVKAKNLSITSDDFTHKTLPEDFNEVVFSPRQKKRMLDWYAENLNTPQKPAFITLPFNLDSRFANILQQNQNKLIYIASDKNLKQIGLSSFNRIAHGDMLDKGNKFLGWLNERLTGLNNNRYIHSKYLLVDPLGNSPIVISGSANFSNPSTVDNDENMLIIKGDKRIADIYFGEFMRIFRHFYFRSLQKDLETGNDPDRIFLSEDDSWTNSCYDQNSPRFAERLYFSGN